MRERVDRTALISGVAVIVIGGLLMLDQGGSVEISAGVLAAIFVGAFGLIMLLSGLFEDR